MGSTISTRGTKAGYLKTENFKLTLNGQSRHLDGAGIDRDYLMDRLMPMVHSNTKDSWHEVHKSSLSQLQNGKAAIGDLKALSELKGRKEIYCFPFSLAPEAASPAGAGVVLHIVLDPADPDGTVNARALMVQQPRVARAGG